MRPSLTSLRKRAEQSAERASAGSLEPAGHDANGASGTARDRSEMRQRARDVRARREQLVRDLGALVVELHRLGRERPELVRAKAEEVALLDHELRGLERTVAVGGSELDAVAAGVTRQCNACAALMSLSDAYCARCGTAADAARGAADHAAAAPVPQPAPSPRVSVHRPAGAEGG